MADRVEELLTEFVASYVKLNGVNPKIAAPKYDHYVEGASDFADFLRQRAVHDKMSYPPVAED